jgi:hypothetical protein
VPPFCSNTLDEALLDMPSGPAVAPLLIVLTIRLAPPVTLVGPV